MQRERGVVALFVSLLLVVSPAMAQQKHVIDPEAIDAALSRHVAADAEHREAVLRLLRRPEVRAMAMKAELDWKRAEDAVRTLEGEELAEVASMARAAEAGLAGGETFTISSTIIIIALLVLILIVVAT